MRLYIGKSNAPATLIPQTLRCLLKRPLANGLPAGFWTETFGPVKKGLDFKIASATVSRTSYIYQNLDGTSVTGMHTGTYLPALPILLLR